MSRQTTSKAERRLIAKLDALVPGRDPEPCRFQVGQGGVKSSVSDLSYREYKVAVYYDGCYWHECPRHFPLSRGGAVNAKDQAVTQALLAQGWTLFRVWEHDDEDAKVAEIAAFIRQRQQELVRERVDHVASHEARAWCYDCADWPHEPWPVDPHNDECMRCGEYANEHKQVPDLWIPVVKKAVVFCRETHLADPFEQLDRDHLADVAGRATAALVARIA